MIIAWALISQEMKTLVLIIVDWLSYTGREWWIINEDLAPGGIPSSERDPDRIDVGVVDVAFPTWTPSIRFQHSFSMYRSWHAINPLAPSKKERKKKRNVTL